MAIVFLFCNKRVFLLVYKQNIIGLHSTQQQEQEQEQQQQQQQQQQLQFDFWL